MSDKRRTELMEQQLGNLGSKSITGTGAVLSDSPYIFTSLYAVTTTVVASQVDAGVDNADLSTLTIPQGITVFGKWSSITLTSGSMIGYNGT
jgi:hypothetical protein